MNEAQAQAPIIEDPPRDFTKGFDLRVTIRDGKTGEVIRKQPYRIHMRGDSRYYERPVKSGNLFFEDGKEAGRLIPGDKGKTVIDAKAKHIEVPAEVPKDLKALEEQNEELRAEVAAMRAEREKRDASAPQKQQAAAKPQAEAKQ